MAQELAHIIWYHRMFGKNKKAKKTLEIYGSYEALYEAVINERDTTGITERAKPGKYTSFSLLDAKLIITECEEKGWEIITKDSEYYPKQLLTIEDYPEVLFCEGNKEVLKKSMTVGIVGSREAAPTAEVIAHNAAYNLAKTGAVIVSGAALGIDSAAHLGAIDADGFTVGVLGCGLGSSYMNRIGEFYDRVLEKGCYITELFPYTNASKFTFPERNRIISGLSRALLVACAAENSGSLITAGLARKQNRRVYAIAPEICYSVGCERLIADGAYSFYNAGDIAYPLKEFYDEGTFNDAWCNKRVADMKNSIKREDMALPKKKTASEKPVSPKKQTVKKTEAEAVPEKKEAAVSLLPPLSDSARRIYDLLGDEPVVTNSLVALSGLKINQVLMSVSELTLYKLIKQLPGSRIQKI